MNNQLVPGTRIDHDRYGIGVVSLVNLATVEVIFERGGRMELAQSNLQAKILNQPDQMPPSIQVDALQLASAIEAVLDKYGALQKPVELGRKWEGGTLMIKPGNPSLKPKEIPVEVFFHKIVMARDRLRVLEQNINSHPVLSDQDKVNLQQYITRIYGSFTTFNVLFEDRDDYFAGEKSEAQMSHPQPVFMNAGQCRLIGSRLETIAFNPDFYHRPFLVSSMEDELKRRMIWFAVVICHQTYALGDPKLNLFGWDYLEHGFLNIASHAPHLLDPSLLVEASQPHLADEIAKWFSPDGSVDNSTLDRREERVRLMVASARFLVDNHQATVGNFLVSTQNTLQGHPMAYYHQLAAVEPFADPLLKKATFMLKLFGDAALFSVTDTGHLIPVMDYHMQRVLLRTGCVQVTDGGLLARLTQRQPLDSDSAIRNAAVEAMAEIARVSRLPVLQMNDVFYMLGRSCCLEKPLCKEAKCDKSPCSLTLALKLPDHSRCLFAGICQGETDDVLRRLWHPVVKTHYY